MNWVAIGNFYIIIVAVLAVVVLIVMTVLWIKKEYRKKRDVAKKDGLVDSWWF